MVKNKAIRVLSNPCPTCGKERKVLKTYQEYVGESLVVTTLTACPDEVCQKKRDRQIAKDADFRARMEEERVRRLEILKSS